MRKFWWNYCAKLESGFYLFCLACSKGEYRNDKANTSPACQDNRYIWYSICGERMVIFRINGFGMKVKLHRRCSVHSPYDRNQSRLCYQHAGCTRGKSISMHYDYSKYNALKSVSPTLPASGCTWTKTFICLLTCWDFICSICKNITVSKLKQQDVLVWVPASSNGSSRRCTTMQDERTLNSQAEHYFRHTGVTFEY